MDLDFGSAGGGLGDRLQRESNLGSAWFGGPPPGRRFWRTTSRGGEDLNF